MDWRWRRLPNLSVLLLAELGLAYAGLHPRLEPDFVPVLLTLLAGLPLLALRVCGAGDVKLCAALALWLPGRMGAFLFGMAAAGLLLALLMLLMRRRTLPYGCAMLVPAAWLLGQTNF